MEENSLLSVGSKIFQRKFIDMSLPHSFPQVDLKLKDCLAHKTNCLFTEAFIELVLPFIY